MKIWYITSNSGDGSSTTEFYDSQECIDFLTDEETCPDDEAYLDGDGGSYGTFECDNFKLPYGKLKSMSDLTSEVE